MTEIFAEWLKENKCTGAVFFFGEIREEEFFPGTDSEGAVMMEAREK